MAQVIHKQAQSVRTGETLIADRSVFWVESEEWDGPLIKLTLRKAGDYFSTTMSLTCDQTVEVLEF